MADVSEERFGTEAEARAFISGLDYADNDHISWEGPTHDRMTDEWVVTVSQFC